ncbi:hypothetical protein [Deinococcus hopiensis]|uniref:hypothetical protein n=1 Tax=Deinococcus hopiensis TaxID=309885 RepID=UPI00111C562C|nr:hypothetical protein [Deinococcus hopiensis]
MTLDAVVILLGALVLGLLAYVRLYERFAQRDAGGFLAAGPPADAGGSPGGAVPAVNGAPCPSA